MIRIADPAKLGPALAQIRNLLGYSRHDLGRAVESATGRPMISVVHQVQQWDTGRHAPTVSSLGPVLDALGYDLALVPREDTP
jgi:hypothetical protein